MKDPLDRPTRKPPEDAPGDPPVPEGEPSRTTEEAGREDLGMRGVVAGGILGSTTGYATGALTGSGGAVGMRRTDQEEAAEEDAPEL
jgi:hypothetical protein